MVVEIRILNNDGTEALKTQVPLIRPSDYKTPYDKPWVDGEYRIFGYVFQPIVQLRG